jgi:hypothetical protein
MQAGCRVKGKSPHANSKTVARAALPSGEFRIVEKSRSNETHDEQHRVAICITPKSYLTVALQWDYEKGNLHVCNIRDPENVQKSVAVEMLTSYLGNE